jgi:hypothetical protein
MAGTNKFQRLVLLLNYALVNLETELSDEEDNARAEALSLVCEIFHTVKEIEEEEEFELEDEE